VEILVTQVFHVKMETVSWEIPAEAFVQQKKLVAEVFAVILQKTPIVEVVAIPAQQDLCARTDNVLTLNLAYPRLVYQVLNVAQLQIWQHAHNQILAIIIVVVAALHVTPQPEKFALVDHVKTLIFVIQILAIRVWIAVEMVPALINHLIPITVEVVELCVETVKIAAEVRVLMSP
jgi:hypothetical protein